MSNIVCIYHADCADGFGAAYIVYKYFDGNVKLIAARYSDDLPDIKPSDIVIMVDFSYKLEQLQRLVAEKKPSVVLIIDHHKSAIEGLKGQSHLIDDITHMVGRKDNFDSFMSYVDTNSEGECRVYAYFDLNKSGAGMAWDFFYGHKDRPKLIDIIEDRDLWRFNIPETRRVMSAVFSYDMTIDDWDQIFASSLDRLMAEGEAIERKYQKDLKSILSTKPRTMVIGGHAVPAMNVLPMFASDVGSALCEKGVGFAVCYNDIGDLRKFSLRSNFGTDVSKVAELYGGGGHRNAAGFTVKIQDTEIIDHG